MIQGDLNYKDRDVDVYVTDSVIKGCIQTSGSVYLVATKVLNEVSCSGLSMIDSTVSRLITCRGSAAFQNSICENEVEVGKDVDCIESRFDKNISARGSFVSIRSRFTGWIKATGSVTFMHSSAGSIDAGEDIEVMHSQVKKGIRSNGSVTFMHSGAGSIDAGETITLLHSQVKTAFARRIVSPESTFSQVGFRAFQGKGFPFEKFEKE